ncbi:intercellular adhesion molecule 3-like [Arapaima gigas]
MKCLERLGFLNLFLLLTGDFVGKPPCVQRLSVTVYKTPDSFPQLCWPHWSLGAGETVQCDIQNVAPVQNLRVKWYKGDDVVNITTYSEDAKTPVNVSSTLLITPSKADDGAQCRCEAELDLGPEGPQPPPAVQSEPLRVTVYCEY